MPQPDNLGDTLAAAAVAGVISPEQAEALLAFAQARTREPSPTATSERASPNFAADLSGDGETLHFVRGMHDIFMSIGIVMLLTGTSLIASSIGALVLSAALSEYLVRRRRLVLPSIVLAVAVVYFASRSFGLISWWGGIPGLGLAFLAACIFYYRYRLPFALMLIAASALGLAVTLLNFLFPDLIESHRPALILGLGLATFAFAMSQDIRDPQRKSLLADNAFWLHLLAAPLMVHGLMSLLITGGMYDFKSVADAGIVIGIVILIGLIAVAIDRRAMLVSGLAYIGFALGMIVRQTEISAISATALTLILLGAAIVALGSGWRYARKALLTIMPRRLTLLLPPSGL